MPTRSDTLRRPAAADTVRATRDSVTVAAPIPPRPDTARIDSTRGLRDSLATRRAPRDSIKAPLARAELPVVPRVGQAYRWTRDSLFASGAVTLLDLLDRVPGVTGLRSFWVAGVQTAAYLGDTRRIRVFRDGVELDAIDPRAPQALDLVDVQLWQADEVLIEPAADEVRVHVRSWSVRNTTPYTRVDVSTGDEDTNLYRGFYGRRFTNGGNLQIGAQNFGTGARNRRVGGGGDAVSFMGRVGWARGRWSADAMLSRVDRERNVTFAFRTSDTVLTRFEGRRDEAYLRVGWGDPEGGPWVQAVANALDFALEGTGRQRVDTVFVGTRIVRRDTVQVPDSSAYRSQYVLTGGFTRWGVRFSLTDRYRTYAQYRPLERAARPGANDTTRTGRVERLGRSAHAPMLRASFDRPWLSVAGVAERSGIDSTTRVDLLGRFSPLPWLALHGGATRRTEARDAGDDATSTTWRAELAARLGGVWLSGGRVARGGTTLPPALPFDLIGFTPAAASVEPQVTGTVASARGRLYKDVFVDVGGTAWDQGGVYRPQYQGRAELRLQTNWLRRFPTGNFGLTFAVVDEYRSRTAFPVQPDTLAAPGSDEALGVRFAGPGNVLSALLEIRIQRATVSYQLRNALNREYQLVPGFTMPGPINFYGVRWEFWN